MSALYKDGLKHDELHRLKAIDDIYHVVDNEKVHQTVPDASGRLADNWLSALIGKLNTSVICQCLSVVVFIGAVCLLVWRTTSVLNIPGDPFSGMWGLQDFRDAVYYPVIAILAGDNPYNSPAYMSSYPVGQHFPPYSPLVLVLHSGFAAFDLHTAGWIYFACIVLMYLIVVRLSLGYSRLPSAWPIVLFITAALLVSRPGYMNLTIGQVAAQLTIATLIALQYSRSRPWLAAIALAFVSIKITWFVPLLLLVWFRGDRQTCVRAIAISVGVTLGPLLWVTFSVGGPGVLLQAIPDNVAVFRAQSDALANFTRVDIVSLATRLSQGAIVQWQQSAITILVLAVGACLVARFNRNAWHNQPSHRGDGGIPTSVDKNESGLWSPDAVVILLVTLACTYHQPYDLVLLVPVALVILAQLSGVGAPVGQSGRGAFTASSLVLLVTVAALGLNFISSHGILPTMNTDASQPLAKMLLESLNGVLMLVAMVASFWRLLTVSARRDAPTDH